jgi:trans-aconitate 2-methyltransferase
VVASVPEYLDVLGATASRVEGWETTYHHVLPGDDPILDWFSGSGLRPFLAALDEPARSQFRAEVAEQLRVVYPRRRYGTVLPFRRIFVIAYR